MHDHVTLERDGERFKGNSSRRATDRHMTWIQQESLSPTKQEHKYDFPSRLCYHDSLHTYAVSACRRMSTSRVGYLSLPPAIACVAGACKNILAYSVSVSPEHHSDGASVPWPHRSQTCNSFQAQVFNIPPCGLSGELKVQSCLRIHTYRPVNFSNARSFSPVCCLFDWETCRTTTQSLRLQLLKHRGPRSVHHNRSKLSYGLQATVLMGGLAEHFTI